MSYRSVMDFLNEPIVIWAFSSVVIALISWGYSVRTESQLEARQKAEKLRNLEFEVVVLMLEAKKNLLTLPENADSALVANAVTPLTAEIARPTSTEFKGVRFIELMRAIEVLCTDPEVFDMNKVEADLEKSMASKIAEQTRAMALTEIAQTDAAIKIEVAACQ